MLSTLTDSIAQCYRQCSVTTSALYRVGTPHPPERPLCNYLPCSSVVLENGYLPQIVAANVPIALTSPAILAKWGFNGLNVAPPGSFPEYQEYVRGLAAAAVKAFGIQSVRRWRWTVLTKFNNIDWFRGVPPGTPGANTTILKLYDYTVCGLRQALGR